MGWNLSIINVAAELSAIHYGITTTTTTVIILLHKCHTHIEFTLHCLYHAVVCISSTHIIVHIVCMQETSPLVMCDVMLHSFPPSSSPPKFFPPY